MENTKIIASVGTEKITQAELDNAIFALKQRGRDMDNPEGRELILDELISQKLFLVDARKNLYEFNPEFKAQMEKIKEEMLINYAISKAVADVTVTDEDAKKFYDENSEKFVGGPTVNASHILVDDENLLKQIKEEIEKGEITFEDAAKKYSTCPSKEEGGNLGDFGRGQMVPEFEQAAFAMEEGQISDPVKTQFGYHLIKLNSKSASKPIEFDLIKAQIKKNLEQEKQQQVFKSKVNQLKILYPVDRA